MRKIEYEKSALLVLDVQRYFFDSNGGAFLTNAPQIIPNIIRLVDFFRSKKTALPIVFTKHAHKKNESTGQMGLWWGENLPWEGSEDAELIDEIKPDRKGVVITKTTYSAFENTGLEENLKSRGVTTVILCGVMTNVCIETTARHAFVLGFQPVIVSDACAAKNEKYHAASILNLSYAFAHIKTTDEIISEFWGHDT